MLSIDNIHTNHHIRTHAAVDPLSRPYLLRSSGMIVSSGSLLLVLPVIFAGRQVVTGGNQYTAVRWLSGREYAHSHDVRSPSESLRPSTLARLHATFRPLFSWDLPLETATKTKGNSLDTSQNSDIRTGYHTGIWQRKIKERVVRGPTPVLLWQLIFGLKQADNARPLNGQPTDCPFMFLSKRFRVGFITSRDHNYQECLDRDPKTNRQKNNYVILANFEIKEQPPNLNSVTLASCRISNEDRLMGNYHRSTENSIRKRPKNVWWPWKNYREWLRSRTNNNNIKQLEKNVSIESDVTSKKKFRSKFKRKYKNKSRKKGKKNKFIKHMNIEKIKSTEKTISPQVKNESESSGTLKKFNDIKCIPVITVNCNYYFNYNNKLKTIKDKPGTENVYDLTENGIKSTDHINPLSLHKKQSYLFSNDKKSSTGTGNEYLDYKENCGPFCNNLLGFLTPQCPPGFRLDSSRNECLDINECVARNGHGPCQGECTNTRGSYRCSCANLTGTRLASDNHSCEDIDECSGTSSLMCSHGCINTVGTAFCLCPDGYQLGPDWRTCQDVDECASVELQGVKCFEGCFNTEGSYKCL